MFIKRNNISNHQYIIIDTFSSKQKCHDSECNSKKYHEINFEEFPKDLQKILKNESEID